ncbi:dTTP/UTP pyrophosphatase-like isoform X2 [Oscarella lobularis]|uniref:dTTP/UTP pyrophosphatase-like isoform X2 n=1 Tax=Oscarella lobularis TaxID=121494 RepID=UPI00331330D6
MRLLLDECQLLWQFLASGLVVSGRPWDYAKATARGKTEEVFQRLAAENSPPNLIIGADSIVILDGEILEKPRSEKDATSMLHRLSGRTHSVISGVALGVPSKDNTGLTLSTFHEETTVDFASITGDMIDYYVSTKEPMDKAGSYGIQGVAGSFVTAIQGDFYNVMGLPLHRTCKEILKLWDRGLL